MTAMDKQEARELLTKELAEYRSLSYASLVARIGDQDHVEVIGSSATLYQIEVEFFWDDKPAGDVRVMGAIDDGGWRAFMPLCEDFIVSPDVFGDN